MKNYRIYVCYNNGYKLVSVVNSKKFILALNKVMQDIDKEKVLVIEHDTILNADTPIFLNIIEDYEGFKNEFKRKRFKK